MKWLRVTAVLVPSLVAAPALSQETDAYSPAGTISIGPSLSTLGLGLELGYRPSNYFAIRAGGNFFDYDKSLELDGIDYDGSLDLRSAGLIADIHPFGGGFRLSFGARLNLNEASLSARPTENTEIGDRVYTPAEIGRIKGEVDFDRFAPYVGLGYEGSPLPTEAFTLSLDLGVMYHGAPNVDLSATGHAATLAEDLEEERRKVEDEIETYKFYPVIALTAKLRF